jgi:hypothetical protein
MAAITDDTASQQFGAQYEHATVAAAALQASAVAAAEGATPVPWLPASPPTFIARLVAVTERVPRRASCQRALPSFNTLILLVLCPLANEFETIFLGEPGTHRSELENTRSWLAVLLSGNVVALFVFMALAARFVW